MTTGQDIQNEINKCLVLMRDRVGIRAAKMTAALSKARGRLPGRYFRDAQVLARAEPFLEHPKLSLTLDYGSLSQAATDLQAYLDGIDVADRRKGWWLGMLGGLSFNLIAFGTLLLIFLAWRGFL